MLSFKVVTSTITFVAKVVAERLAVLSVRHDSAQTAFAVAVAVLLPLSSPWLL